MDINKLFRSRTRRRRRTKRTYSSTMTTGSLQQPVGTPRSLNAGLNSKRQKSSRRQRNNKESSPPRSRIRRPDSLPPVLVRSGRSVLPVQERRHEQPRRQYNVSLNVPGAEIRLPAMPTVQLNWRVASGALFALLAVMLFHLWTSSNFRVLQPEVIGNERISNSDINTVVGIVDKWIFSVDAKSIREQLVEAFPDFKGVAVTVKLPNLVTIEIQERQPVLAWQQNGNLNWVDAEGMLFPARGEADLVMVDAKNMPPNTISNPILRTTQIEARWVSTFQKMAEQAPEGVPVLYSAERGLGWVDPQGWEVFFGTDFSNMEQKLLVYEALVNHLQQESIQPMLVSVEYVHAPYYRLEP